MSEFDFIKKYNLQKNINEIAENYKDKKIVVYGAGKFSKYLFENYDFSKLNIIAIADKKFEEDKTTKFFNLNCVKPDDLKSLEYDAIIILNKDYGKFYNIIKDNILKNTDCKKIKFISLLKKTLPSELCGKICKRPFHIATVFQDGKAYTCCPAYLNWYSIGNVFERPFNEIWNSEKATDLRNMLINDDYSLCDLDSCIQLELIDKQDLKKEFYNPDNTIKMPDQIYMGWDYDCNVACITCRNKLVKNDEKTLAKLKALENSVLDACKTAKLFYTSGNGDPFGSKYSRDLIKKVVKINPEIKFFIHTNGILCTEEICEELGIKNKITNVIFSIHASCEDTYNKVVRFGNYNKVIKNLEWISKLKKQGQINKFILAFVVQKLNYKDMPDFVRLAEKFNALASFRHYRQWANNTEYKYEDMAVFEQTHEEYENIKTILKQDIFNSPNCSLDNLLKEIKES